MNAKTSAIVRLAIASTIGALLNCCLSAQDECSEILVNGTLKSYSLNENFAIDHILVKRFLNSSYESSKKDKKAGFGVPIGEIFIKGVYDESKFKEKQAEVRDSTTHSLRAVKETTIAVSSGDPEIVGAWLACMKGKRGPFVIAYTTLNSPTDITVTLKLQADAGINEGVLAHDVSSPGCDIVLGPKLKKGLRITTGEQKIVFKTSSHLTPLNLVLNVNHVSSSLGPLGSAEIYVVPRIQPILEYDLIKSEKVRLGVGPGGKGEKVVSLTLSKEQVDGGWSWDEEATPEIERISGILNRTKLQGQIVRNRFLQTLVFTIDNNAKSDSAASLVGASAQISRVVWKPIVPR